METKQNRFKSVALWASVVGAIWTILSAFGVTEEFGITNEAWNSVFNGIGGLLVAFGILNNPTDSSHF